MDWIGIESNFRIDARADVIERCGPPLFVTNRVDVCIRTIIGMQFMRPPLRGERLAILSTNLAVVWSEDNSFKKCTV